MTASTLAQSSSSTTITLRCECVDTRTMSAELLRARLVNADRSALAQRIQSAARS